MRGIVPNRDTPTVESSIAIKRAECNRSLAALVLDGAPVAARCRVARNCTVGHGELANICFINTAINAAPIAVRRVSGNCAVRQHERAEVFNASTKAWRANSIAYTVAHLVIGNRCVIEREVIITNEDTATATACCIVRDRAVSNSG